MSVYVKINMIYGIANMVLILIVLPVLLIRCSLTLASPDNGTYDGMMFIENDLQCLAQMPVGDLMKIQKAIRMMRVVSAYDAHHHRSNVVGPQINNQNHNQSDSRLRELDEPMAETRNLFQHFGQFTASTTKSPLAEAFIMTGQVHDAMPGSQFTHKTGWASEWEEEKPSKVQKVLHYSITALTFLAFAGYLLCMIVQAIKSKGTTYYHPGAMTMMAVETDNRFVTTKRVNGIRPNRYRRNTKAAERITIAEPDPISMFQALLAVSKGYVQLNSLLQPPH